jgi:hypothetical protein
LTSAKKAGQASNSRKHTHNSSEKRKYDSIHSIRPVLQAAEPSINVSVPETHGNTTHLHQEGGSDRGESGVQPHQTDGNDQALKATPDLPDVPPDAGAEPHSGERTGSRLDSRALRELEGSMDTGGARKVAKYMMEHEQNQE